MHNILIMTGKVRLLKNDTSCGTLIINQAHHQETCSTSPGVGNAATSLAAADADAAVAAAVAADAAATEAIEAAEAAVAADTAADEAAVTACSMLLSLALLSFEDKALDTGVAATVEFANATGTSTFATSFAAPVAAPARVGGTVADAADAATDPATTDTPATETVAASDTFAETEEETAGCPARVAAGCVATSGAGLAAGCVATSDAIGKESTTDGGAVAVGCPAATCRDAWFCAEATVVCSMFATGGDPDTVATEGN
jgi:hypothetical protein